MICNECLSRLNSTETERSVRWHTTSEVTYIQQAVDLTQEVIACRRCVRRTIATPGPLNIRRKVRIQIGYFSADPCILLA